MKTVEQKLVIVHQQYEPGDIVALAGIQECEVVACYLPPAGSRKPAMLEVKGSPHIRSTDQFSLVREARCPSPQELFARYEARMVDCLSQLSDSLAERGITASPEAYGYPVLGYVLHRLSGPYLWVILKLTGWEGETEFAWFYFEIGVGKSYKDSKIVHGESTPVTDRREARALDLALRRIEATDWQAVAAKVMFTLA